MGVKCILLLYIEYKLGGNSRVKSGDTPGNLSILRQLLYVCSGKYTTADCIPVAEPTLFPVILEPTVISIP
mgnify:CR=1 FL=1